MDIYALLYIYIHKYIYQTQCVDKWIYIYIYIYMNTYTCIHIYIYICVCVCVCTSIQFLGQCASWRHIQMIAAELLEFLASPFGLLEQTGLVAPFGRRQQEILMQSTYRMTGADRQLATVELSAFFVDAHILCLTWFWLRWILRNSSALYPLLAIYFLMLALITG